MPLLIPQNTAQGLSARLDADTRTLMLKALRGVSKTAVAQGFVRSRYGDLKTYVAWVREVWGSAEAREMTRAMAQAAHFQPIAIAMPTEREREEMICEAALFHMPEADFRLAMHEASQFAAHPSHTARRIASICKKRGLAWDFTLDEGFRRIPRSP
jgi:hypothetical protein